jgi:hypothetical protein
MTIKDDRSTPSVKASHAASNHQISLMLCPAAVACAIGTPAPLANHAVHASSLTTTLSQAMKNIWMRKSKLGKHKAGRYANNFANKADS